MNVTVFKMPFKSNHFNEKQKVWLQNLSGNKSCLVRGKFRGRGRYVSAWISWDSNQKESPSLKNIEVSDDFAKKHKLPTFEQFDKEN